MRSVLLSLALLPTAALAQTADRLDGLHAGVEASSSRYRAKANVGGVDVRGRDTSNAYGGFMRYDERYADLYFGAQADAAFSGKSVVAANGIGTTNIVDPKWAWAISTRIGIAPVSNLLAYGRFGYASIKIETLAAGPGLPAATPLSDRYSGLQYGAGIEAAILPAVSIRAEYRQNDYSSTFKARQLLVGASIKLWECC